MALIEWRDEFAIGIASVDYEHQGMIQLINKLHEDLAADASKDSIIEMLGEIHNLISAHFALEEKEMVAMGYDGFEAHKDDHERLLDEIRDMMDEIEDGAVDGYEADLSRRLDVWFTGHFKTADSRLHHFLKARRG